MISLLVFNLTQLRNKDYYIPIKRYYIEITKDIHNGTMAIVHIKIVPCTFNYISIIKGNTSTLQLDLDIEINNWYGISLMNIYQVIGL